MHPDRPALLRLGEQLGPVDPRSGDVRAVVVGAALGNRRLAEDGPRPPLPLDLAPGAERAPHAAVERPRARVVGLVPIEPHHALVEIEVGPVERERLVGAHPLAVEDAPEETPHEGDRVAAHEGRVLAWVQVAGRARLAELREEARGDRVRGEEPRRVHSEAEQAMEHLRNVTPRRRRPLRGDARHDVLDVAEVHGGDGQIADLGEHVRPKDPVVAPHGPRLLRLHVVGPLVVQPAARPLLGEVFECDPHRDAPAIGNVPLRSLFDHAQDRRAVLGVVGCDELANEPLRHAAPLSHRDQPARGVLGLFEARARLLLARAVDEKERHATADRHTHARVELPSPHKKTTRSLRSHSAPF